MTEQEMDDGIRNLVRLADRPEDDEAWKDQLWALVEPRDPRVLRKLWTMRPFDSTEHYLEANSVTDMVAHFPDDTWMTEFLGMLPELESRNAWYLVTDMLRKTLRRRSYVDGLLNHLSMGDSSARACVISRFRDWLADKSKESYHDELRYALGRLGAL